MRLLRIITFGLLLGVGGCGYYLVGTGGVGVPAHLKTLFVAPLVNQTGRPELDQRLSEELSQEWLRRGRFRLVGSAEEADAVLSGTLVGVHVTPVQFDPEGRATQYQLLVVADMKLVDRTGEQPKELWHEPRLSRTVTYEVDASAADYFDRELEAIERLSREFARSVVVAVLEGF
ncbi:MAG: LPS assembly lipoprotein LptE [Thermoanaerobaculum sp.]|nr:LPS assembly lipoprotein LptE [Thermoanaerobaculum sp.]MDW7968264.1 LptE family protein [Thermoanaerobaculum sp.]